MWWVGSQQRPAEIELVSFQRRHTLDCFLSSDAVTKCSCVNEAECGVRGHVARPLFSVSRWDL